MFLVLLLDCTTDVSIMKRQDHKDTTIVTIDSGETSTEPSAEPSSERTGVTGYAHLHLRQVACPMCMGETQEITIKFSSEFHEPSSDGHTDWMPSVGECTTNVFGMDPSTVPMNVGSLIQISNPSHNFSAPLVQQGLYETTDIWEAQLQRDATYKVQTDAGSFSFLSTRGFDYIEPYTMLWVDPSYAFDAPIYRSGASFYWGPQSFDSTFLITVAVYSSDGSQMIGYVTCSGEDSGSMTIPSQHLQTYPVGSLVAIHLARHQIDFVETDINNSFMQTHMEWEVVGTGHIE